MGYVDLGPPPLPRRAWEWWAGLVSRAGQILHLQRGRWSGGFRQRLANIVLG